MSKSKHKHKIRHGKGERERERERGFTQEESADRVSRDQILMQRVQGKTIEIMSLFSSG